MSKLYNIEEFKDAVKSWLFPMGYSIHAHSPSWNYILLTGPGLPAAKCRVKLAALEGMRGEATCSLEWSGLKMFIHLATGDFSLEHPDIRKYIMCMSHYGNNCENNPPF